MSTPVLPDHDDADDVQGSGTTRRRFLTYLVAAPTLAVAVGRPDVALAAGTTPSALAIPIPTPPAPADVLDLGDVLILAAKATEPLLIVLGVGTDGTVSCALPREEVGQGITTAISMLIADELDTTLAKVKVTLADARPELMMGQLTGGSNTVRSVYQPVRNACALVKARLRAAAARKLGVAASSLVARGGAFHAPDGRSVTYGAVSAAAADPALVVGTVTPKDPDTYTIVGKPTSRVDARKMVTGQQKYTLDLEPVPGAARAMVRRPPTINGTVKSITNEPQVRAMPGVLGLYVIPTGVAVLASTFGQALDAKEALQVTWNAGTVDGESNDSVFRALKAATPPVPPAPPLTKVVDGEFTFAFASHAPMETNSAIADIRATGGTVWAGLKSPIVASQEIAKDLGLPVGSIKAHVVQAGGSFGRRLFFDGALEAARISKAAGRPVKLLWTRVDDTRHGRARAASFHRIRAVALAGSVVSFDHQVGSVETDFRHGLGEVLTATAAQLPVGGNLSFAQTVFLTTIKSPYDFGRVTQLLTEIPLQMHTGSFRSVYSANTRGAEEVIVDELAKALGQDPAAFRRTFLKTDRQRAVLDHATSLGSWGRAMPAGFAQGLAFHDEYKSCTACLVELDARDPLDPRVTKATVVADVGRSLNPRGLESQLLGGLTDAISTVFRAGLHLDAGLPLEGSYSQYHYARQADSPRDVTIHVMPPTTGDPGGAGELGLPAAVGAIANAYARATGTKVRNFPLIFPVDFTPFPRGAGSTRRHVPPPPR